MAMNFHLVIANFGSHLVIILLGVASHNELYRSALALRHNVQFSFECFCVDKWQVFVLWYTQFACSFFSALCFSLPFPHSSRCHERVGLWKMHTGHKYYLDGYVESVFLYLSFSLSLSIFFTWSFFALLFLLFAFVYFLLLKIYLGRWTNYVVCDGSETKRIPISWNWTHSDATDWIF